MCKKESKFILEKIVKARVIKLKIAKEKNCFYITAIYQQLAKGGLAKTATCL